jgi:hypothetical protein
LPCVPNITSVLRNLALRGRDVDDLDDLDDLDDVDASRRGAFQFCFALVYY